MEGQQIAVQRSIDLRIGPAETVVVTVCRTSTPTPSDVCAELCIVPADPVHLGYPNDRAWHNQHTESPE